MMKTKAKNNSLTKKVLFSILAAGMLSGFALSAEAADNHIELFQGTRDETSADVSWIFVNRFETNPDPVSLTLNGGKVTGGDGEIDASGGATTVVGQLSGSTGYPNKTQNLTSFDVAAYAKGIGKLIEATNVNFTGEIAVNGDDRIDGDAKIIINGGSITAGKYYYNDPTTGKPKSEDKATYITAFNKGKIELTNVVISSNISACRGGKINVNNSSVNDTKDIYAAKKIYAADTDTEININFDATEANKKGSITVGSDNDYSDILAEKGAKISINNADINKDKTYKLRVKATGEGSVLELNNSDIRALYITASDKGQLTISANSSATVFTIENNTDAGGTTEANTGGIISINGSLKTNDLRADDKGEIYLQGGDGAVYEVARDVDIKEDGKLYIKSGTLKALANGAFKINDKNESSIVLEGGIISTISKNIYTNEASAIQNNPGEFKKNGIVFNSGSLILNDAQYTLAYAQAAQSMLSQKGSTKLTMAGNRVDENGDVNNTMSTNDIYHGANKNIDFDQLKVIAEGNLLVGSYDDNLMHVIDGITVHDCVPDGFGAGFLDLGSEGAKNLIITKNKEVTLGGSLGGNLITVNGKDVDNIQVVVGITEAAATAAGLIGNIGFDGYNGNLNIGNALAKADTKYTIKGDVTVNPDSKLNSKGQTEITKSLTLNEGTVDVKTGSLKTKDLKIIGTSNLFGTVNAESLDVKAGEKLLIGNQDKAGKLTVNEAYLHDGMVFLDPVWKDGMTISDASGLAVKNITAADGAYVVGRNSVLALGADLSTAENAFAQSGQDWGEKNISAAAYIAAPVDVTSGSITVNGKLVDDLSVATTMPANASISFAANSLLMVDADKALAAPVITGVSTANIDANAKLYIDKAKKGETYKILAGTASNINSAWAENSVISNNSLFKFTKADEANAYTVTTSIKTIDEAFGTDQVTASNAYDAALKAQDEGDAAYDFIMAAADTNVNHSKEAQVNALNSAAAMSELAGVEHSTYAVSNLLTDAVAEHMSLVNAKDHDSDIWAKYIHTKEDVDGLSIANFGAAYKAQYNGIVVGADLYKNGKTTVGAALTYVDGNINGSTLAARTKNEATYYGASIYGGIRNEDSAVIGDISYLHGKHDITQYNSGKTLTADAKADAFSMGVRAEKSIKAGVGKFVPYAGLRYMHLGTGNYTNSIGMSYDGDDANLWLLPVGVKYSAEVKAGSWTLRPLAEVGYVWNMGDREATQTVSLNGASDGFGYDVTDSGSYIGRFGIEAEKANITYGLGYEYQKGDSVKPNRWTANLNWSF